MSRAIPPNRKIRLVQIGFGHIGMRRTLLTRDHPGIDVVGVCDIKRERLNLAREVLGEDCAQDTSYLRLLATVRPDAAIISTPNALHGPMTLNTLRSGVHTLCEKPLTTNTVQGEQAVALASSMGLVLKVGSNHRFWRGVREILARIEAGGIGEVMGIDGEIGYRLPDVRSEWYREREVSGGGTIIDNTPHLLDVVNQILRVSDGDQIRSVRCATTHDALGLEVEDRAEGLLTSDKGRSISLVSTWSEGEYRMNVDVQGTRGRISIAGFDHLTLETRDRTQEWNFSDVPAAESWEMDIQAFVDGIRFHVPLRGSGEEGLRCVRIIEALYRSSRRMAEEVTLQVPPRA